MNPLRRFLRQSIRRLRGLFSEAPGLSLGVQVPADPVEHASQFALITSARKLLTNRSYGVSYHLCSG